MKLNSKIMEPAVLFLFFTLFLYLALGSQWDNRIKHDFPYGYGASDAFFHQSVAEYMKAQGIVKYTPPYEVGNHDFVYDAHPPMLFVLSSQISIFSGIEVYDSILLLSALLWIFSGILVYILIKRFNKMIALLSVPVMIFTLTGNFKIPLYWGYWLFIAGVFFLIAAFWAFSRLDLHNSWILLGLFMGALGISHIPEVFFVALFIAIYFAIDCFSKKKFDIPVFRKILFAAILALLISAFSLNIFFATFAETEGFRNKFDTELGNGSVYLKDIGLIGLAFAAGLIVFLVLKKKDFAGWFAIFMFFVSYLTLIGFGKRAATHRWFWYFYLAFFFGLLAYQIIKLVYKNVSYEGVAIISIVLLIIFSYPLFSQGSGSGIMNAYDWQGLSWIADNVPKDARVFYFYSDALGQSAALYNSKHLAFNLVRNDLFEAIQNKEIRRTYQFGLADSYAAYLCDATPFNYRYFRNNPEIKGQLEECTAKNHTRIETVEYSLDICDADYIYFDKQASQPVLAQYNLIVRQILLQNNYTEQVYENELVSIIKNNDLGEDCLGKNTSIIKLE